MSSHYLKSDLKFRPWPLKDDAESAAHTIDPETGIWPLNQWGSACGRGFVSDARFARPGDQVIKRTNRAVTRKWLRSAS